MKEIKEFYTIPSMCGGGLTKCKPGKKYKKVHTALFQRAGAYADYDEYNDNNPDMGQPSAFNDIYDVVLYIHGDNSDGSKILNSVKDILKDIAYENNSTILFLGPNGRKVLGGPQSNLWYPGRTFITDTLNAIADDLGINGAKRQLMLKNARIHLYGFSAGGRSISHFVESKPDYLDKVVHLQFNDAVWSWRIKATDAILSVWHSTQSAHKVIGKASATFWFSKDSGSANHKAAALMAADPVLKAVNYTAHKLTGGHGSAITKIDKASFKKYTASNADAMIKENEAQTASVNEAMSNVTHGAKISADILRIKSLPLNQMQILNDQFKTMNDEGFHAKDKKFDYVNKFVAFANEFAPTTPVIFYGAVQMWSKPPSTEYDEWICPIDLWVEGGALPNSQQYPGKYAVINNSWITKKLTDLSKIAQKTTWKAGYFPSLKSAPPLYRKLWSDAPEDAPALDATPTYNRQTLVRFILLTTVQEIRNKASWNVAIGDDDPLGDHSGRSIPEPTPSSPNPSNFAVTESSGKKVVVMRLGDIMLYQEVLKGIMTNLDAKLTEYKVTFDKPFNPLYYADLIKKLFSGVQNILHRNSITYDPNRKIRLEFSSDYKELLKFFILGTSSTPSKALQANFDSTFLNQTMNAIIWNMPKIYNRYGVSFQSSANVQNIFLSGDEIKAFVNKYIVPIPKINMSSFTSGLLQRFVIGDTRLLDDDYHSNYFVRPEHMGATLKHNLDQEISQQYEQIGDFLGNKWISGEFKDINNVEDLYKQLLDHIDMKDVISISAQCLLKMIPADEWLDDMCAPILEKFDEYKAAIIGELESMDDGISKNLAKELYVFSEQQMNEGLDTALKGAVELGSLGLNWLKELYTTSTWAKKDRMVRILQDIHKKSRELVWKFAYGESSVSAELELNTRELKELKASKAALNKQLEIFRGNPPAVHAETLQYYNTQIGMLSTRNSDLNMMAKNIIDQLRQYNFIIPIDPFSIPTPSPRTALHHAKHDPVAFEGASKHLDTLSAILTKDEGNEHFVRVMAPMIQLNPYLTMADKKELFSFIDDRFGNSFAEQTDPLYGSALADAYTTSDALTVLSLNWNMFNGTGGTQGSKKPFFNSLNYNPVVFTFGSDYIESKKKSAEASFDANVLAVVNIFKNIQMLSEHEDSPDKIAGRLKNFGHATGKAYLESIFADPTKRRKLCLAIYAAIGSVGYLVYLLIVDPRAVGDWFADQAGAIYKGFSRKLEIFTNLNYPVQDILKALGETLYKVAKNLGRDILINGIMMVLDVMRQACQDQEQINAPYNPVGAVDLSSFMTGSKKGGTNPTTSADTGAFLTMLKLGAGISASQFETILSTLSSAFTINETCRMLSNTAPVSSYSKAIRILRQHSFIKNNKMPNSFYNLYMNEAGMKELYKLLSRDIEPAFCAQAIKNFEREKDMLLEMCFSRDDTALRDIICRDKTSEECLDLMSSRAALPSSLLRALSDLMPNLMGPITPPDPCEDGEGIFDESQKYTAGKIGNAIFGSIETRFESDLKRVKQIYLDTGAMNDSVFGATGAVDASGGKARIEFNKLVMTDDEDLNDTELAKKEKYKKEFAARSKPFAGVKIIQKVKEMRDHVVFVQQSVPPDHEFSSGVKPSAINDVISANSEKVGDQVISFSFDPHSKPANTSVTIIGDMYPPAKIVEIVDTDAADEAEDPQFVAPEEPEEPDTTVIAKYTANRFEFIPEGEPDAPSPRSPERILFAPSTGIATTQPEYNTFVKDAIGTWAENNNTYIILLNSIWKDLVSTSALTALFKRETFAKLQLNKKISLNNCFLGFLNSDVLTMQLNNLAQKLTCYNTSSATATPVNVAMAKIALDILIRVIAVKELTKSIFIYGVFPSELKADNEESFYDRIVSTEIATALSKHLPSGRPNSFYENVVKTFIDDIQKILYQDEELSSQNALDLIKDSQFGFVKQQFIISLSLPRAERVNTTTEYSMTKDATNVVGEEVYLDFENILNSDKLEALTSDGFTNFINFQLAPEVEGATATAGTAHNQIQFFTKQEPKEIDGETVNSAVLLEEKLPFFDRRHQNIEADFFVTYFNFDKLLAVHTQNLDSVLKNTSGTQGGIVMEKMVEMDYSATKYNPVQLQCLYDFFAALDLILRLAAPSYSYDAYHGAGSVQASTFKPFRTAAIDVASLLLSTKLIMFVPQLADYVNWLKTGGINHAGESLPDGTAASYLQTTTTITGATEVTITHKDSDGEEKKEKKTVDVYSTVASLRNLKFADMFVFNFGMPWLPAEKQAEKVAAAEKSLYNEHAIVKTINWEYSGKIDVENFATLLESFGELFTPVFNDYGWGAYNMESQHAAHAAEIHRQDHATRIEWVEKLLDWKALTSLSSGKEYTLHKFLIKIWATAFGTTATPGFGYADGVANSDPIFDADLLKTTFSDAYSPDDIYQAIAAKKVLYSFARLFYSSNDILNASWYDDLEAKSLDLCPTAPSWTENENQNFFQALINKPVNDIFVFNTVFRLNSYTTPTSEGWDTSDQQPKNVTDYFETYNEAIINSGGNPLSGFKATINENVGRHRFGYGTKSTEGAYFSPGSADAMKIIDDSNTESVIIENIGEDGIANEPIQNEWFRDFINVPLFELKLAIPTTVSWFDFFIDAGIEVLYPRERKTFTSPVTKSILEANHSPWNPGAQFGDWTVNDYLFTNSREDKGDLDDRFDLLRWIKEAGWILHDLPFDPSLWWSTDIGGNNKLGPTQNVWYYLDRLRFADVGALKRDWKYVDEYDSSWWFNIRNCIVPADAIIKHVEDPFFFSDGRIPGWQTQAIKQEYHGSFLTNTWDNADNKWHDAENVSFVNMGDKPGSSNDPLGYLCEASKASLQENHAYFTDNPSNWDDDGNWKHFTVPRAHPQAGHPNLTAAGPKGKGGYQKTPAKNISHASRHAGSTRYGRHKSIDTSLGFGDRRYGNPGLQFYDDVLPCNVGTFDLKNKEGVVIQKNFPKWIRIKQLLGGTGGDKNHRVDYGFPILHHKFQQGYTTGKEMHKRAKDLQINHPGANYHPYLPVARAQNYQRNRPVGYHNTAYCQMGENSDNGFNHDEFGNFGDDSGWYDGHTGEIPITKCFGGVLTGLANTEKITKKVELKNTRPPVNAYKMFSKILDESDPAVNDTFTLLIQAFFLKEQSNMIAALQRAFIEENYPQLDGNFNSTIRLAVQILTTAMAVIQGDYQHNSPSNKPGITNRFAGFSDIDIGAISKMLAKSFVRALATTADPTWKTEWFLPGPLTPFGVAAKLMDEDWGDDDDDDGDDLIKNNYECVQKQQDAQIAYFSNYIKSKKEEKKNS